MLADLFIRILSIFLIILLGAEARRRRMIDNDHIRTMSAILVNFFYPGLIFSSLVSSFTVATLRSNLALPLGTVIIMTAGYLLGLLALAAHSLVGLPARGPRRDVFHFQCTINNYGFLPLPLVYMLWGEKGVAFLVFSTFGAEIMVWTLGMLALGGNRFRRRDFRRLLNVPVAALLLALVVIVLRDLLAGAGALPAPGSLPGRLAGSFMDTLAMLGAAVVPLALFTSGGRMAELRPGHLFTRAQAAFSLLRLVVIPAAAIFLVSLLPLEPVARLVLFTVAVMPAAVTSVVLSDLYRSDPVFAASGVLTSHFFSLFTIPLWLSFLLSRFPVA